MRRLIPFLVFIVSAALAGCAPKQLPREEFLALRQQTINEMIRTYKNQSKDVIIAAAEKVLTYSDDDYKITQHTENGFYASRDWFVYMVISAMESIDNWQITVEEQGGDVVVKATSWHGGSKGGILPMPMSAANPEEQFYVSPSLYRLFFDRLEYFLNIQSAWPACAAYKSEHYQYGAGLENALQPLCSYATATDPTKASVRP